MDYYTPYRYNRKTMLLDNFIILGEVLCDIAEYDLYDMCLHPFAVEAMKEIECKGYAVYEHFSYSDFRGYNCFEHCSVPPQNKLFLYAEVFSLTNIRSIIYFAGCKYSKLWVNNQCVAIHPFVWLNDYFVTADLKKGKNTFLLEFYSPKRSDLFSLQLRDYKFETESHSQSLSMLGNAVAINPLTIISDPIYNTDDETFRFMCWKNDNDVLEEDFRLRIYDNIVGFVREIPAKLNQPITINIAELRNLNSETLRNEWLGCFLKKKNGEEITTGLCIFLNDFTEAAVRIGEQALTYAREISDEVYINIQARVERQSMATAHNDFNGLFWLTWYLKEWIDEVEQNISVVNFYTRTGVQEFYIHSELDNSTIRILANIPQFYSSDKKYPVLLALATGTDGTFCAGPITENFGESCLAFDVSGRGFTGGSYIGEASILEIIQWICSHYAIDENRIYLLGLSNGGYATYAIAQNYPSLPAAVYPLTGYPYLPTLINLHNMPVYQMVSPMDYVYKNDSNQFKRVLGPFGLFHQYDFEGMIHQHFVPYIYHKEVFEGLRASIRNPFPNRVIYYTVRNRHRKSFWIELHGIAKGKRIAKIQAKICHAEKIVLSLYGTNGVTVTLPPQINRKYFQVILNRKTFTFRDCQSNRLIFRKKQRIWTVADEEPIIDNRKGTGILDVYLNSMRIIIPEDCTDATQKAAAIFSNPYSNGSNPVVSVKYPIYSDKALPNYILSHNLILFDSCQTNSYVKRFFEQLMVAYDNRGYTYKNQYYESDYLILQAIPNPTDNKRTLLIVSTNNEDFYKIFLIRKLTIPYFCSGLHPFLNNEAMIFDGKRYYGIYENGDDMCEIK